MPAGATRLSFELRRGHNKHGTGLLRVDESVVATFETRNIFALMVSWSGLDVGLDRGTAVSFYDAPYTFTGTLERVCVDLIDDQALDAEGAGNAEMMRE